MVKHIRDIMVAYTLASTLSLPLGYLVQYFPGNNTASRPLEDMASLRL